MRTGFEGSQNDQIFREEISGERLISRSNERAVMYDTLTIFSLDHRSPYAGLGLDECTKLKQGYEHD